MGADTVLRPTQEQGMTGTVFDMHHKDIGRVNDFIRSEWPQQPHSAEKLDMNSFVAWAVSTTQNSTVLLMSIGLDSVFTYNTYSRNPLNPWLISQGAEHNKDLKQHIVETWQGMEVPNDLRDRVDQIAKHVFYEYERETGKFILKPLEWDGNANVRVYIRDINIWSHPPRDDPLRRVLEQTPDFEQKEGNLLNAARGIQKISENPNIPSHKKNESLQRQKDKVRQKFIDYYKYFSDLECSGHIPESYKSSTLQLAAGPDRYGNASSGVYGANDDEVHHKFPDSNKLQVRGIPSMKEVFDRLLKDSCGLSYDEFFHGQHHS